MNILIHTDRRAPARLARFIENEAAVTAIEYALIAALIAVAIAIAVGTAGTTLATLFSTVAAGFP
jgi:pilus assembly protein Flp/PilA